MDHLDTALTFTAPLVPQALLGGEPAYDGPFYKQRSPINVVNKVNVPTFFIGGEYDLFQRGTPLLFENLQKRGIPTKMVFGPWGHLQGSAGTGLADAGYGSLEELQLRWFDHYVKGMPDPTPQQRHQAADLLRAGHRQVAHGQEPGPEQARRDLVQPLGQRDHRASATAASTTGHRRRRAPRRSCPSPPPGSAPDRPTSGPPGRWTCSPFENPCVPTTPLNDLTGVAYETEPLTKSLSFRGPLNARLYVSSLSGDGMLSVAVEDVAPDGTVHRISGGWQVLSFRKLVPKRSRYLHGTLIQPFHPFTKKSKKAMPMGGVRAGRRRDLPDRRADPSGAPAAHRGPALRHPTPDGHRQPTTSATSP